jgi:hypothetical protein
MSFVFATVLSCLRQTCLEDQSNHVQPGEWKSVDRIANQDTFIYNLLCRKMLKDQEVMKALSVT